MSNEYVPPHMLRRGQTRRDKKSQYDQVLEGNGPLGTIMLMVLDTFVDILLDFCGYFVIIFKDGMNFVHNMTFGQYNGIFGSDYNVEKYGSCFTFKFLRYFITIITPPIGIFLSKGIKGWFSLVLCMILCYFHYIVGIVYAFVVTHNNRYADRYEDKEVERIARIKAEVKKKDDETPTDIAFYIGLVIGVFTFVGLIYLMVRFS